MIIYNCFIILIYLRKKLKIIIKIKYLNKNKLIIKFIKNIKKEILFNKKNN